MNLRKELKRVQPYYIETCLLPKMYFNEDEHDTEYWIFVYAFLRGLSDQSIGVRLGYSRQHILKWTKKIIERNHDLIFDFILKKLQTDYK